MEELLEHVGHVTGTFPDHFPDSGVEKIVGPSGYALMENYGKPTVRSAGTEMTLEADGHLSKRFVSRVNVVQEAGSAQTQPVGSRRT